MVRSFGTVRSPSAVAQRVYSDGVHDPNVIVEHAQQIGAHQHLIEDVPEVENRLSGSEEMCARRTCCSISETPPHGVVKEWVFVVLYCSCFLHGQFSRHDTMKAVRGDHPRLKRVHVQVAHENRSLVAMTTLGAADFPRKSLHFLTLIVVTPIHLTWEMEDCQEHVCLGKNQPTDRHTI